MTDVKLKFLVFALLQYCSAEISNAKGEWYSANVINDPSYSPRPLTDIFPTTTFSPTNPIVVLSTTTNGPIRLMQQGTTTTEQPSTTFNPTTFQPTTFQPTTFQSTTDSLSSTNPPTIVAIPNPNNTNPNQPNVLVFYQQAPQSFQNLNSDNQLQQQVLQQQQQIAQQQAAQQQQMAQQQAAQQLAAQQQAVQQQVAQQQQIGQQQVTQQQIVQQQQSAQQQVTQQQQIVQQQQIGQQQVVQQPIPSTPPPCATNPPTVIIAGPMPTQASPINPNVPVNLQNQNLNQNSNFVAQTNLGLNPNFQFVGPSTPVPPFNQQNPLFNVQNPNLLNNNNFPAPNPALVQNQPNQANLPPNASQNGTLPNIRIRLLTPGGSITNVNIGGPATTARPRTTTPRRIRNMDSCINACTAPRTPICAAPFGIRPVNADDLKGFQSDCHLACNNIFRRNLFEKVIDGRCGRLRTRIRTLDAADRLRRPELNRNQYTIVQSPGTIVEFQPMNK